MKKKYDWKTIQIEYDGGMSHRKLIDKYRMSTRTLYLAVQRGDLISRTKSEAGLLDRATNARSADWHREHGRQVSATINQKVSRGEWHTSLARHLHFTYNGVDLHGAWELAYAKYLDANNIKWLRCKKQFRYDFLGKERKYTPDFYLPDTNEYIEIKGYETDKDRAKWSQFPETLIVLKKKELTQLNII